MYRTLWPVYFDMNFDLQCFSCGKRSNSVGSIIVVLIDQSHEVSGLVGWRKACECAKTLITPRIFRDRKHVTAYMDSFIMDTLGHPHFAVLPRSKLISILEGTPFPFDAMQKAIQADLERQAIELKPLLLN